MNRLQELIGFLTAGIWRIRARRLNKRHSFWINQLRIFLLAVRGFNENQCQLRASALTYYSLLSIVPIVAMAFGIAKGFGLEKLLEDQIMSKMAGQQEVAGQIVAFARSFLENTQGGVIAGVGVVILFWTVVKVLGQIEDSFNDIWGVKKGRSMGRKFSDYLSMMMVCPVLLIMSGSLTVLAAGYIVMIAEKLAFLGPVAELILSLIKILPYMMMWILFTFIYIFMPHTKVQFKSGLMGGIIAGTIYQIAQLIYIHFQIGVSKFGAVYGSFAALPLFLVWLQTSWLIVLFGAEVSFAEQNVDTYEFEPDCLKASRAFQQTAALAVARLCIKRFDQGLAPLTSGQIAHELEMPIRLVRQILFDLTGAGVLSEVKIQPTGAMGYQPARDIEDLTIQKVLDLLDHQGVEDIPFGEESGMMSIRMKLNELRQAWDRAPQNAALKDI